MDLKVPFEKLMHLQLMAYKQDGQFGVGLHSKEIQ
jgi:hypothetical protein